MKVIPTLFLFFISLSLLGQSDIPINAWKSYLPKLNGVVVTQSEEKIIYGTEWSIFTIDKEENFVEFLSKVEGLSDVGIKELAYDNFNDQLIIIYDNSNIDIVKGEEVFNINNIRNNTNIVGERTINALEVTDETFCYFATSFGIVQYNLKDREFGFTTFTEEKILDISSSPEALYIATDEGIYTAPTNQNANLADFGVWNLIGEDGGLPADYNAALVHYFDGHIYVTIDNQIYQGDAAGQFTVFYEEVRPTFEFTFMNSGSRLMVGVFNNDITSEVLFFEDDGSFITTEEECVIQVKDAIEDQEGRIWFADTWNDVRYTNAYNESCQEPLSFNTPHAETTSDICFSNGNVFIASGGVSDAYGPFAYRSGIYRYNAEKWWRNYNESTSDAFEDFEMLNSWQIENHPNMPIVYVGSYYNGLLEFNYETKEFRHFNKDNGTSLQGTVGNLNRTRISGLAFDKNNNLWMTNFGAPNPISVFTAEGNWHSFESAGNDQLGHLTIDNNGYVWAIAIGNNGGVMVFDPGLRINDPSDDEEPKFFNVGNSELSTNLINYIKADLNGDVWVGTAEGPVVFECGTSVFDDDANCRGSRRKVLQDSIAAFLLQTEDIRVIEIDGANRKWFGTRNGIFVQSADGEEQILHLTIDNSPLFDNTITALSFNPETGEMWIGTNKGMQSFRTDATGPENSHREENVIAFPNPVRPGYNGPIAIKGLVEDAEVKITDVNGQLIYQTTSLGGQAIWDGRDYNGRKAASGVYLVFSSSTNNFFDPDTYATKILIVN